MAKKTAIKEHSPEKSEILTEREKILNELKEAYK